MWSLARGVLTPLGKWWASLAVLHLLERLGLVATAFFVVRQGGALPTAAALADYCRAVVLTSHVAALPDPLRDDFVSQVVDEIIAREGAYTLDYVRLNLNACA